ncbi:hypothetical protein FACS1894142_3390 [Spirochaetia bacterium]|nr:hypothetical protein FACS1894142_3390 [Spirochaetia bacterium]
MSSYKNTFGIPFSRDVDITRSNDEQVIFIKINYPCKNMQENAVCFEALSVAHKAIGQCKKVEIEFEIQAESLWFDKSSNQFKELESEQQHYMRFLYRLMCFTNEYYWSTVKAGKCKNELDKFVDIFSETKMTINCPDKEAGFNPNKGLEHILENMFLKEDKWINKPQKMKPIFNQLPVGLFKSDVSNKNRIFPAGKSAIDLWGIDDKDNLCIFELKKPEGNSQLGIISELFFYASLINNIKNCEIPSPKKNFRGYAVFYKAIQNKKPIKAFFLVSEEKNGLYPRFKENEGTILQILNDNKSGILYEVLYYSPPSADEIERFCQKRAIP